MTDTVFVPQALRAFFEAHPKIALAFSGGVDSGVAEQKAQRWSRSCWPSGAGSTAGLVSGRLPRPGTVHTSVPVNGLTCLIVPSAMMVMGSRWELTGRVMLPD